MHPLPLNDFVLKSHNLFDKIQIFFCVFVFNTSCSDWACNSAVGSICLGCSRSWVQSPTPQKKSNRNKMCLLTFLIVSVCFCCCCLGSHWKLRNQEAFRWCQCMRWHGEAMTPGGIWEVLSAWDGTEIFWFWAHLLAFTWSRIVCHPVEMDKLLCSLNSKTEPSSLPVSMWWQENSMF